jgi:DNA polymerase III subunit delta'
MTISTEHSFVLYPWQQTQWKILCTAYTENRLHHALFVTGTKGLGQYNFAWQFANFLLCEAKLVNQEPCKRCSSCCLFQAGNHPDFRLLTLDEGTSIKIETIRQLSPHSYETSSRGGAKVVLIYPADTMNLNSANALLKMLEEPPQKNYFFLLIADEASRLPPTLLSRLMKISFKPLPFSQALAFIKSNDVQSTDNDQQLIVRLCGGVPLASLDALKTKRLEKITLLLDEFTYGGEALYLEMAQRIKYDNIVEFLDDFYLSVYWIVLWKLQSNAVYLPYFIIERQAGIKKICHNLSEEKLFFILDQIIRWKSQILAGVSLNKQFIAESLFYYLSDEFEKNGY